MGAAEVEDREDADAARMSDEGRREAGQGDGGRGAGAEAGRHPLRAMARRDGVRSGAQVGGCRVIARRSEHITRISEFNSKGR